MGFLKYGIFLFAVCSITVSSVQVNDLTKGLLDFTRDFYTQCVETKPGNVIVSPVNVANVLALLSQGSSGNTYEELRAGLHLSSDKSSMANQFSELRQTLQKNAGESEVIVADRIYVQKGQTLNKNFKETAVSLFHSDVETLNFAQAEKSAQTINEFVEEKTNGKVKDLIKSDMLNGDIRSVLVSAIYFKGTWDQPFFEEATAKRDFYSSESEKQSVDFMNVVGYFNHVSIEDLKADVLEMKYANSDISFVILLPEDRMGLSTVESKLKTYDFSKIFKDMVEKKFMLYFPKFKAEYEINVKEVLNNLGITDIFSDNAELKGILESGESLKVSEFVHKATIDVNENGSEAAAGACETSVFCSMPMQLNVDHPFMYFIRDTKTNTIFFSGRIEHF